MTETEKTIEILEALTETEKAIMQLEVIRGAAFPCYEEEEVQALNAAIIALRTVEEIREMCAEEREAGYCHADLDTLEELLP